jgi:lipid A 3-O-deacylase
MASVLRSSPLLGCALALGASCYAPKSALPSLSLVGGGFSTTQDARFAEGGLELRSAPVVHGVGAMAGATLVEGGGLYVYGGLRWPRALDEQDRWRLTPSVAAGLYDDDNHKGLDLGGSLEFRTALELSYAIRPWARVGVYVAHLSNASIYDQNGGAETAGLALSFDVEAWLSSRRTPRAP